MAPSGGTKSSQLMSRMDAVMHFLLRQKNMNNNKTKCYLKVLSKLL